MEKAIERILSRKYPELEMGWHLPLWAKVVDNGEALAQQTATEHRPVYAVSVRILDCYGNVDAEVPVINDVLVPVPAGAANQRGQWSKPLVDTVVELAFAYGSPAHPFIRSILPHGLVLPTMGEKDQRWQQSEQSYIEITEQNDWTQIGRNRQTDIELNDTLHVGETRQVTAKDQLREIELSDTLHVGETRTVTAKDQLREIELSDTLHVGETRTVTAKNQQREIELSDTLHVGETRTITAKNSAMEIEEGLKQRIGQLREIIASKHWVGDDATNIYQLLHDLMVTVADLSKIAGTHTHPYTWSDPGGAAVTSPPIQTSSYTQKGTEATQYAGQLKPLLK